ncbi:hypothetical protein SynRS9907_00540 [Synechococcus sp. RS9907]|nr:hypothetical protein SynRS9907_00540 [Synechococcus sp. RS9907]
MISVLGPPVLSCICNSASFLVALTYFHCNLSIYGVHTKRTLFMEDVIEVNIVASDPVIPTPF